MKTNDYPSGSTFGHDGAMVKVVGDSDGKCCDKCYFNLKGVDCRQFLCTSDMRGAKDDVRFEKL